MCSRACWSRRRRWAWARAHAALGKSGSCKNAAGGIFPGGRFFCWAPCGACFSLPSERSSDGFGGVRKALLPERIARPSFARICTLAICSLGGAGPWPRIRAQLEFSELRSDGKLKRALQRFAETVVVGAGLAVRAFHHRERQR